MSKSDEYRQFAADCLEVAGRMSLRRDRERMMGMAQRWLELAQKAEAKYATAANDQTPAHGTDSEPEPRQRTVG